MQIVIEVAPASLTIALEGDLDAVAAEELDARVDALVTVPISDVFVELGALSYLSTTGIRSFIRLDKKLRAAGKRLVFRNVAPPVIRTFQYCAVDKYFIFETAPVAQSAGTV